MATALGNFFKFWAYASTVIGAVIAGKLVENLPYSDVLTDLYQTSTLESSRQSLLLALSTPSASSFSLHLQHRKRSSAGLVLVASSPQ